MAWPWRPAARRPGPTCPVPTRPAPALHRGPRGPEAASLNTSHDASRNTPCKSPRAGPGQRPDSRSTACALAALPGQTGNEVWAPLGQTGNEGPGRKGGRSLAAVGSGDPGLHGARGLGLSWAPGLVPTPAEVGGGRQGPPTGPSVLGTQLWLSTPAGTLTRTRTATQTAQTCALLTPGRCTGAHLTQGHAGGTRVRARHGQEADARLTVHTGMLAQRARDPCRHARARTRHTHRYSLRGRAPRFCRPTGHFPAPQSRTQDAEGRAVRPHASSGSGPGLQRGDMSSLQMTTQRGEVAPSSPARVRRPRESGRLSEGWRGQCPSRRTVLHSLRRHDPAARPRGGIRGPGRGRCDRAGPDMTGRRAAACADRTLRGQRPGRPRAPSSPIR